MRREVAFVAMAFTIGSLGSMSCSASELGAGALPSADAGHPAQLECSPALGLLKAEQVLSTEHPCRDWTERNVGRVAKVAGFGTGSLWTTATNARTGLFTTATHVLSPCTSGASEVDANGCAETLQPPRDGATLLRFTDANGVYAGVWSAAFPLFNAEVPRRQLGSSTIRPRYEPSVYVVDGTTYPPWDSVRPEQPSAEPLDLFDPAGQLSRPPTWGTAVPNSALLVLGYPMDPGGEQFELALSVARVLSRDEIEQAFARLRTEGDEEAELPYDEEAEFFLEGSALNGMSGAGLFDHAGRQIGILVRGSSVQPGALQILRAVRMSFVVARMEAAYAQLDAPTRAAVEPYLERR